MMPSHSNIYKGSDLYDQPVPVALYATSSAASAPIEDTNISDAMIIDHQLPIEGEALSLSVLDTSLVHPTTTSNSSNANTEQVSTRIVHARGFLPNSNAVITGGNFTYGENITINNVYNSAEVTGLPPQKPNVSALFTGQQHVLDKLRNQFSPATNGNVRIRRCLLLYGMGGIGKTQVCLKFIDEMFFSDVFWIDASSRSTIIMGLSRLPAARAAGVDGSVQSVLQWMAHLDREWLLVFDNADGTPQVVEEFIPAGSKGNLLITSRNKSVGRLTAWQMHEMDDMIEEDAIALLLKASCLDLSYGHLGESARQIVVELCYLPLAIDQAGAAIQSGLCSIENYLEQFHCHRKTLMSHSVFLAASQYEKNVYGTWEVSFKEIELCAGGHSAGHLPYTIQTAKTAVLILKICAFFHNEKISKDIFKFTTKVPWSSVELPGSHNGGWSELHFKEGLQVLLSFSLIKGEISPDEFSIHPLVHCWTRDRLLKTEQLEMCQLARRILFHAGKDKISFAHVIWRQLVPHIQANYKHSVELGLKDVYNVEECSIFQLFFMKAGLWKEAEELQNYIISERRRLHGSQHPTTWFAFGDLARTYMAQGKWKEAEKLQIPIHDACTRLLGPEHQGTLRSKLDLAGSYQQSGKWTKAEELQTCVLNARKKLLGSGHPETLHSLMNLANTHGSQGKWKQAEEMQLYIVENLKRLSGTGSHYPSTLVTTLNLSVTYLCQGRWKEAEKLQTNVLNDYKKLFGAEHPRTLRTIAQLSLTYKQQGRWKEAEEQQIYVLETFKRLFGAQHLHTLQGMSDLAVTYNVQGRWKEAEKIQLEVIDIFTSQLGMEHPTVLSNMSNLSLTYSKQGRFADAEKLQSDVLDVQKGLFGAEHPSTLFSLANLARIYSNQKRCQKAVEIQVDVLNTMRRLFGAEHPETLSSISDLAMTYSKLGKYKVAEELQSHVLEARKRLLGAEHPDTVASTSNLALTHRDQGRLNEAEEMQIYVLNARTRLLGAEHPDTLTSVSNLLRTYRKQGKFNEADQLQAQFLNKDS